MAAAWLRSFAGGYNESCLWLASFRSAYAQRLRMGDVMVGAGGAFSVSSPNEPAILVEIGTSETLSRCPHLPRVESFFAFGSSASGS